MLSCKQDINWSNSLVWGLILLPEELFRKSNGAFTSRKLEAQTNEHLYSIPFSILNNYINFLLWEGIIYLSRSIYVSYINWRKQFS